MLFQLRSPSWLSDDFNMFSLMSSLVLYACHSNFKHKRGMLTVFFKTFVNIFVRTLYKYFFALLLLIYYIDDTPCNFLFSVTSG